MILAVKVHRAWTPGEVITTARWYIKSALLPQNHSIIPVHRSSQEAQDAFSPPFPLLPLCFYSPSE